MHEAATLDDIEPRLLLFSAKHPKSLSNMISHHQSYQISNPDTLGDMAYSLALKRETLPCRAFCVTDGTDDWNPVQKSAANGPQKLVFIFSGQGAQWAQMGKDLIQNVRVFRQSLEALDRELELLPDSPGWKLMGNYDALHKPSSTSDWEQI